MPALSPTNAPSTVPACAACGATTTVPEERFGPAPLFRCERCAFMGLDSEVDPALYGDAYFAAYAGGDYLAEEAQRRRESRRRLDLLARTTPPPARLLEVGAAAGFLLDEARRRGYAARTRASLLARGLAEALRARAPLPAGPHPSGHQLLRAAAWRPRA